MLEFFFSSYRRIASPPFVTPTIKPQLSCVAATPLAAF